MGLSGGCGSVRGFLGVEPWIPSPLSASPLPDVPAELLPCVRGLHTLVAPSIVKKLRASSLPMQHLTPEYFFYSVAVMADREYLGEFEQIVLLAVLRLADNAYGVTVKREIEERISREVSIAAIYTTLDRLEGKGYVKSQLGKPSAVRGGRAKRLFQATPKGVSAINRTQYALKRMIQGLDLTRSY